MKKLKLLRTPTAIGTIRLDDLDYDAAPIREDKAARVRARRWRKLRNQTI